MEKLTFQLSFLVHIINLLCKKFTTRLGVVKEDSFSVWLTANELMLLAEKGCFEISNFTNVLRNNFELNYVELYRLTYPNSSVGICLAKFDNNYHYITINSMDFENNSDIFKINEFKLDFLQCEIFGLYSDFGYILKIGYNSIYIPTPKFYVHETDYLGETKQYYEFFDLKLAKKTFAKFKGRKYKALNSRKNKVKLHDRMGKTLAVKWVS